MNPLEVVAAIVQILRENEALRARMAELDRAAQELRKELAEIKAKVPVERTIEHEK